MIIVESTVKDAHPLRKNIILLLGTSIITIPLIFIAIGSVDTPTGTYISPLPAGELSSVQTPTFERTLNLSQISLDKAFELSGNQEQTESDRHTIIQTLNLSLSQINDAINLSPKDPRGYLMRARILTSMSKINPDAISKAQEDLEIAQQLSNGHEPTLPAPTNPLNFIPEQQASLAQNIIIASDTIIPTSATQSANPSSNAIVTTITLPSGELELTVKNPDIDTDSYIYLVPKEKSATTVFVKSKTTGSFVMGSTSLVDTDLLIDYWIINK